MITATILDSGNLRLSASKEVREELASLRDYEHWGDLDILLTGMEHYWTNGGFEPFDAGQGNPFVGLTSAPCIAESMLIDEEGKKEVFGGLWWFPAYEIRSPIDELIADGHVVFTLAS